MQKMLYFGSKIYGFFKNHKKIIIVITIAIITVILFFAPPFIVGYWYISKITINKNYSDKQITLIGLSKEPLTPETLNIGSSTARKIEIKNDSDFVYLNTLEYLDLFNIKPDLIRHSIFLDNSAVKMQLTYKLINSNEEKSAIFESTLFCDDKFIETGKSKNKEYLLKRRLILNNGSDDRLYVEKIINNCIHNGIVSFKNILGYPIVVLPDLIKISSEGIRLIIKPEFMSKIVIYISFFVFWNGVLLILKNGPLSFYLWFIKKLKN